MGFFEIIMIVFGLALFESVTSFDNAVINADILRKMSKRMQKIFLTWGLLFAVFLIRGCLPLLLVLISNPYLGVIGALTATFSSNPQVIASMEESASLVMMAGGVFLVFLFFHWLFLEEKEYGLHAEKFIHSQGAWFFAVVSIQCSL